MVALTGACIIAQSGGPTAVINATALGVIKVALGSEHITKVLCSEYGVKGIINDRLFDMGQEDEEELALLPYTPGAIFGTTRYKLNDFEDYRRILETLKKHDVRYIFFIGGNDSMDTAVKIDRYLTDKKYECRVIGIPKTIDNDLPIIDHCPGYGSTAKYVATSVAEIYQDVYSYGNEMVAIVEIMGRHAGWLAGTSALARLCGAGPDLIYLPEVDFKIEQFISDAKKKVKETGKCIVAVSEGIHYSNGDFVSATKNNANDGFGHARLGGVASFLAESLKKEINVKIRPIELSLLQRCATHCVSITDLYEAETFGTEAVQYALEGNTGMMVGVDRENKYFLTPLTSIANTEKKVPREWIGEAGNDVTPEFIKYVLPLIQGDAELPKTDGLPRYANLKKILVN